MTLTTEQTVRLLRAKAAELEGAASSHWRMPNRQGGGVTVQDEPGGPVRSISLFSLSADLALIATLLADHIERNDGAEFLSNMLQRLYGPGPAGDTIRVNEDGTPWRPDPDQP